MPHAVQIITVINAKGGCGKSTIAMNLAADLAARGARTLLVDMEPQAQVTQWLDAGDGLTAEGILVAAFAGRVTLADVVQPTAFPHLFAVASAEGLEDLGRRLVDHERYAATFARLLAELPAPGFDYDVLDSPNQISPVMENTIYPADLFVVPFESTKAVKSYANFYKLLLALRPGEPHRLLHALSNLSRQRGLRNRVIALMTADSIPIARTEVRSCGWRARADEHGGAIRRFRPRSRGAADMACLTSEVLDVLTARADSPMQNDVREDGRDT
jgi:chromosome partitioning protein